MSRGKSLNRLANGQNVPWVATIRMTGVGVDGDTITIAGKVYHLDNGTAAAAGAINVDITGGQSTTQVCTALAAAISGQFATQKIRAINFGSAIVLASQNHFAITETLTNGTADAGAYGGQISDRVRSIAMVQRVATAAEATDAVMRVIFDADVNAIQVDVRTAAGAKKAWDGAVQITGEVVLLVNGAAVDWIAGDIVTITASVISNSR